MPRWFASTVAIAGLLLGGAGSAEAHGGHPSGTLIGNVGFIDLATAGISYEWTVVASGRQKAELVYWVGAKSWSEPSQPGGLKGSTYWSNWIALDLTQAATIKITVERQQGVVTTSGTTAAAARFALVPALSLYRGWDDTSETEGLVYNNVGNFWSTIEYIGSAANPKGRPRVVYRAKLPAGHYSIAIGGNPPPLADLAAYPPNDCDPVDPVCYQYTGVHGYRATIDVR
jgi:hypothetical protein